MADYDFSDLSESSYADARADTPTLGDGHGSDSEDTLSNLSLEELDNPGLDEDPIPEIPIAAPRKDLGHQDGHNGIDEGDNGISPSSTTASFASALNGSIRVCVTDADLDMADSLSLDLPPGAQYLPTSVDLSKSPSQLKILKGDSFMPKEEPGMVSEDESSVSSYQAQLDVNGQVRLTKKESISNPKLASTSEKCELKPNFVIPKLNFEDVDPNCDRGNDSFLSVNRQDQPHSYQNDDNALDDYIEDFILPMSHESVMSRQLSFRRTVQKTYDKIAADKASQELDKFEAMLSTYDEEDENNRSLTPTGVDPSRTKKVSNNSSFPQSNKGNAPPIPKSRTIIANNLVEPEQQLRPNFDLEEPPQSILDIDMIVKENAPNLMNTLINEGASPPTGSELESLSNYFLPQQTIDKLYAVYESSNFNNIYCLSGEIKNILSPSEIEEILDNKDTLQRYIDPNVMAALHWSLNPASLPPNNTSVLIANGNPPNTDTDEGNSSGLKSKSSSMSNGFHSDASSEDDNHSNASSSALPKSELLAEEGEDEGHLRGESGIGSPSPTGQAPQRGTPLTNSMRRRIAVSKGLRSPEDADEDERDDLDEIDLGVGDEDWEEDGDGTTSRASNSAEMTSNDDGTCLLRRDSKRFSFKGKDGQVMDRVVEALFVESMNSNPKGTLRKIKVPLNLSAETDNDELEMSSPEPTSLIKVVGGDGGNCDLKSEGKTDTEVKGKHHNRRKISVDENILNSSMISSTEFDDGDISQATNPTQSDIFYSIRNSTLKDDGDSTMRTENGVDDDEITLDIDTPDDMEDSIMGQLESLASPQHGIPPLPLDPEGEESMRWKSYRVGPADVQIDLHAIQPYRKCLSHGGYFDAEKNVAIILFSGCHLPDRSQKDYTYLMDHLFLYVLSTLEELIVEDYMLVYLHGATPKACMPSFGWLKKCYQLIDHRLRKNLQGIYLVHPTFWLRTVVALTRPFVSTKFSRKVRFMYTLSDLCLEIPTEHLNIPDSVLQYDFDLKVDDLKKRKLLS